MASEIARAARRSPDFHAAVDDDVNSCHVRAVVGGQEQRDIERSGMGRLHARQDAVGPPRPP
jgi:hypothetical protein